jgi:N-acetylmuramoyl-L-alanine amidase
MAPAFRRLRRRNLSLGHSLGGAIRFSLGMIFFGVSLTLASAQTAGDSRTVVIDAGHGGFDRGGIPGQVVAEKTMALDVAQRVARKLSAAGYHIIMTRDGDYFVTLGGRVAIANVHPGAIFVCIHFNSATRSAANGIETYYYRGDSARLAANIHRQVVGVTATDNRGIRRRGYFVLRRTSIPSVLVECGFLTNPNEARLALQSSYRDRLADAIAAGVEGKPAPFNRPVVAGLRRITSPIAERHGYDDFVLAGAERPALVHHAGHSSRNSHSKSQKKKSTSSKKKSTSRKKKKTSSD